MLYYCGTSLGTQWMRNHHWNRPSIQMGQTMHMRWSVSVEGLTGRRKFLGLVEFRENASPETGSLSSKCINKLCLCDRKCQENQRVLSETAGSLEVTMIKILQSV